MSFISSTAYKNKLFIIGNRTERDLHSCEAWCEVFFLTILCVCCFNEPCSSPPLFGNWTTKTGCFATPHPCEKDLIVTLIKADSPDLVDIWTPRILSLALVFVLEKLIGQSFTVRFVKHVDPWAYPVGKSLPAPKLHVGTTCVFRWVQSRINFLKCCTSSHLKVWRPICIHLCFVGLCLE